jgi:hypothetical protein
MSNKSFRTDPERLEELIEEATTDAYDDEEQHSGLLTMIEEHLGCPFKAKVIGEEIEVTDIEWPESGLGLKFTCHYKDNTYSIDATSLEWIEPFPEGFEWVEAYFAWLRRF